MTPVVTKAKVYLKVRHKMVRDAMKELKLDGILLTHATDVTYLTNFTGEDSIGLITAKEFYLITDFRYHEQAMLQAGWLQMVLRDEKMADAIVDALLQAKVQRVGYEANYATVGQIKALEIAIADRHLEKPIELVPLEDVMINIRKVKDDHEIDLIRKSVSIAEETFQAIVGQIKPGLTENYLAGLIIFELRSRGATDASFPVIVASGANSSLPHYRPGESLIQQDNVLLIDWGAHYKGYCSDLTRTLLIGRVSDKMRKVYKIVQEAQEVALRFLRPGVTTTQADRVARDVIERAGYGKEFGHGLGHGLGAEIHEHPAMRKNGAEEELRPGMIVTVEPGIYIPGEGGIRIEDDVLITHSGCELLTTLDRSMEACHID